MARRGELSAVERFLRLFADVRAGEGTTALLLAANVFLILSAYYIIKPVRDGLVLAERGPEIRAYLNAGTVLVLAFIVPAYGWLADRFPRRKLINVVTWLFAGALVVFFLLGQSQVPLGVPFFIFGSMFAVMIVAQFWSFANDIYERDEGERLFPIVAFGASLGGVLGVTFVSEVIEGAGVYVPMLIAAGVLLLEVQITNYVDHRERSVREAHLPDVHTTATLSATGTFKAPRTLEELEQAAEQERRDYEARERGDRVEDYDGPASGKGAFGLVLATPYLLSICLLVMLLNLVNTNGEYILSRAVTDVVTAQVTDEAAQEQAIAAFYADFYTVVNWLGLAIQLFLVSRIIKFIGIRWAVMILPVIALGTYATIAFIPFLAAIRWSKTAENATDYSLNNTVRHALFLPTTREQKYKGKQVSDSFFHRAGDILSSLSVFVMVATLGFGTTAFALYNLALVVIWLGIAWYLGRSYRELVATGRPPATRGARTAPAPGSVGL